MKKRLLITALCLTLAFNTVVSCLFLYQIYKNKISNSDNTIHMSTNWVPNENNPIIGDASTGSLYDPHVIKVNNTFLMYVSIRDNGNIGVVESKDGINWSDIKQVLHCDQESGWEQAVSRCSVVYKDNKYYMYYTGQQNGISRIGLAISDDGYNFKKQNKCIITPEYNWEGNSVMNPFVLFDQDDNTFKMWYSAGETFEPDVVCYAESKDGITFNKNLYNPVFSKGMEWYDSSKVSVGCVIKRDGKYIMFYIGYKNKYEANICCAVSENGKSKWRRHEENPIVVPTKNTWCNDSIYKPSVIFNDMSNELMLYCNGRNGNDEYIGLYTCPIDEFTY